jgi:transglutaminase-like putative cysteine protease
MAIYLRPTQTIDCHCTAIKEKARELTAGQGDVPDRAKKLFYFIRDAIKYNFYIPDDYRASRILERREGFYIQKTVLVVVLARSAGIPAYLHLAMINQKPPCACQIEITDTGRPVSNSWLCRSVH